MNSKLIKKLCAISLSVIMLGGIGLSETGSFLSTSLHIYAASAETSADSFEYEENDDGTITVTGFTGSETDIIIPSEIDGKKVTEIGGKAFYECTKLISVTMPDSVYKLGDSAFYGCTKLKEVILSDALTKIGNGTFYGCSSLLSVTLPTGITEISNYAFLNCSHLTSITIPQGVIKIGDDVFYGCTRLANICVPDSVSDIGVNAFNNTAWYDAQPCGSIYTGKVYYKYKGTMPENTNIIIANGTKGIAGNAFAGCRNLTGITIPDTVVKIGNGSFSACSGLTDITIPKGVAVIDRNAFMYCTGLTQIILPDSVEKIDTGAFSGCKELKSITILNNNVKIGGGTFWDCPDIILKGAKDSTTEIYAKSHNLPFAAIEPLENQSSLSHDTIELGDLIKVYCEGTGGTAPYTYAVYYRKTGTAKWSTVQSYRSDNSVAIEPKAAVDYEVRVAVKDATGKIVIKDMTLTVNKPLRNNSKLGADTIKLGEKVKVRCFAKDGAGDYQYAVYYRKAVSTKWSLVRDYGTYNIIMLKPAAAVNYIVRVDIKDASGKVVSKTLALKVAK